MNPESPAVDAAEAVQAALKAWEAAKAASNLVAEPLLAVQYTHASCTPGICSTPIEKERERERDN